MFVIDCWPASPRTRTTEAMIPLIWNLKSRTVLLSSQILTAKSGQNWTCRNVLWIPANSWRSRCRLPHKLSRGDFTDVYASPAPEAMFNYNLFSSQHTKNTFALRWGSLWEVSCCCFQVLCPKIMSNHIKAISNAMGPTPRNNVQQALRVVRMG